jgi:hypothetical protein
VLRRLIVILSVLLVPSVLQACGSTPSTPQATHSESCKDSDGPTAATVRHAIAAVPTVVPGSFWVEIARGHAKKCRLHWVQIIPTIASESTPQQLVFFDHNAPLGTPTPNPKPYITVLAPADDTVTVQYQWQIGKDEPCCPTGRGTVKFQIGSDGQLHALGKIPNQ